MKVQTVVGQVLIILDAAIVDTIHRNCAHFHRYSNNRHIHLSDEWTSVHCYCCPQMEFAKCLSATHFTSACDAHLESDGIKNKKTEHFVLFHLHCEKPKSSKVFIKLLKEKQIQLIRWNISWLKLHQMVFHFTLIWLIFHHLTKTKSFIR